MMTKILIASKNKHKIQKLTEILQDKFSLIENLLTYSAHIDVEENGDSFLENAKIKAKELSNSYNGYVIATDGGAEIPALKEVWNPLYTKRFAGENKTDADRVNKILELMQGKQDRRIWFNEAFAIYKNGEELFTTELQSPTGQIVEVWDGRIKFGAYLLALWYLPNRQKMFFDLTPEEMSEEENTWRELKVKLVDFFKVSKTALLQPIQ